LAWRAIQVHAIDAAGHVLTRRLLTRDEYLVWCAQLPAGCIVAMEANSSAHHLTPLRDRFVLCLDGPQQARAGPLATVTDERKERSRQFR
jgi:hypothetical protein